MGHFEKHWKECLTEGYTQIQHTLDQHSEEIGYMTVYINEIAEEEGLDLDYWEEYDYVFEKALKMLREDEPNLDFEAIETNKKALWHTF